MRYVVTYGREQRYEGRLTVNSLRPSVYPLHTMRAVFFVACVLAADMLALQVAGGAGSYSVPSAEVVDATVAVLLLNDDDEDGDGETECAHDDNRCQEILRGERMERKVQLAMQEAETVKAGAIKRYLARMLAVYNGKGGTYADRIADVKATASACSNMRFTRGRRSVHVAAPNLTNCAVPTVNSSSAKPAFGVQCASLSGLGQYGSCTQAGCIFDTPTLECSAGAISSPAGSSISPATTAPTKEDDDMDDQPVQSTSCECKESWTTSDGGNCSTAQNGCTIDCTGESDAM